MQVGKDVYNFISYCFVSIHKIYCKYYIGFYLHFLFFRF